MELLPPVISSTGAKMDTLFFWITGFVLFALFISWSLLLYPLLRFRGNPQPRYLPGHSLRQFFPVILILIVLATADFTILIMEHPIWADTQSRAPAQAYPIGVVGKQWTWEFLYPGRDGVLRTPDDLKVQGEPTLVIPVHQPIKIYLYGEDVLHSFFVPALRFKYDLIPGRTVVRWFVAEKEGSYEILCAELCGVLHARMRGILKVVSQEEFARFLNELEQKQHP